MSKGSFFVGRLASAFASTSLVSAAKPTQNGVGAMGRMRGCTAEAHPLYEYVIDDNIVARLQSYRIMTTVTVSPKFQVVIPREVRRSLGISPGEKMKVMAIGDRIEFVPLKTARALRGFVRGIDTAVRREKDRV